MTCDGTCMRGGSRVCILLVVGLARSSARLMRCSRDKTNLEKQIVQSCRQKPRTLLVSYFFRLAPLPFPFGLEDLVIWLVQERALEDREVALESVDDGQVIDASSVEFFQLCVRETMDLLRPLDREIVSLRIQQHTVGEISEMTGRTRRTVERSLQNSRKQLANLLLDEE